MKDTAHVEFNPSVSLGPVVSAIIYYPTAGRVRPVEEVAVIDGMRCYVSLPTHSQVREWHRAARTRKQFYRRRR